jgi:hypothetical protein
MPPAGALMIKLDTVFVVGAGASVDYGFPLGEQLTKQIAEALDFNESTGSKARELMRSAIDVICQRPDMRRDWRELFKQARVLRGALTTSLSIDAFLENHSGNADFVLLGKLAIAACLIGAEHRSDLRPRHSREMIDLSRVADSWLARLFRSVLVPGISQGAIHEIFANVGFVVFNYDRCIEHYFEQAIASHFVLNLQEAGRIVHKHLSIVHPYGDLGALHRADTIVDFGPNLDPGTVWAADTIYAMSQRVLTFTESKKAQGAKAKEMVSKAQRLVFLGFGFGEQNVELLRAPTSAVNQLRATVKGLSKSSQREVRQRIELMTGKEFALDDLLDCDCASLINGEQMFLTRST